MLDVRVEGAEQLQQVIRDLREAPKEIRKQVMVRLRMVGAPLADLAREEAARVLPSGLGPQVADSLKVRTTVSGTRARVKGTADSTASVSFKQARRKSVRAARARTRKWLKAQG